MTDIGIVYITLGTENLKNLRKFELNVGYCEGISDESLLCLAQYVEAHGSNSELFFNFYE